jgi:4'-phosphopantetheinyl transferase EntD
VTALKNHAAYAVDIAPPPDLPSFAAFAVSPPSEPVPIVESGEEELLAASMVPARREAFSRGRAAAHAALRAINLDGGPVLSGSGREPLWPDGATGAISHAAGFGVALVAPSAHTDGVGVDLEERRNVPELWDHVPRPEERRWLEDLDATEREAALVALFSAKESVFKAFYPRVGSYFGFERASLAPTSSGFVGRLTDGLDHDYPSHRTFEITSASHGDLVLTAVVLPKTAAIGDMSPSGYRDGPVLRTNGDGPVIPTNESEFEQ